MMLPEGRPYLLVKISAASNTFIVDIGTEAFWGYRRPSHRKKPNEWVVKNLKTDIEVARGMDPAEIIKQLVIEREALILPAAEAIQ